MIQINKSKLEKIVYQLNKCQSSWESTQSSKSLSSVLSWSCKPISPSTLSPSHYLLLRILLSPLSMYFWSDFSLDIMMEKNIIRLRLMIKYARRSLLFSIRLSRKWIKKINVKKAKLLIRTLIFSLLASKHTKTISQHLINKHNHLKTKSFTLKTFTLHSNPKIHTRINNPKF